MRELFSGIVDVKKIVFLFFFFFLVGFISRFFFFPMRPGLFIVICSFFFFCDVGSQTSQKPYIIVGKQSHAEVS